MKELKNMKKIISWFSCGATSAVATKIAISRYGKENVRVIYFDISTAHTDNERFIKDCEKWFGVKIERIRSKKYNDQFDVIEKTKYVNGVQGARCTLELKRLVRKEWEKNNEWKHQIFGFEFSPKELDRANRIVKDHAHTNPIFPLIENKVNKVEALVVLERANIEIPKMYLMGYPNNNCIGCVKGGMGYWNKIRVDFPATFEKMAKAERVANRTCLKESDGTRIFLDELDPNRGRELKILVPDCGFFCGDIAEYI